MTYFTATVAKLNTPTADGLVLHHEARAGLRVHPGDLPILGVVGDDGTIAEVGTITVVGLTPDMTTVKVTGYIYQDPTPELLSYTKLSERMLANGGAILTMDIDNAPRRPKPADPDLLGMWEAACEMDAIRADHTMWTDGRDVRVVTNWWIKYFTIAEGGYAWPGLGIDFA